MWNGWWGDVQYSNSKGMIFKMGLNKIVSIHTTTCLSLRVDTLVSEVIAGSCCTVHIEK